MLRKTERALAPDVLETNSVLGEFLLSLPPFVFGLFALFQVSELGYWIAENEQASFFAARADFVDQDGEGLAQSAADRFHRTNGSPAFNLSLGETVESDLKPPIDLPFVRELGLPAADRALRGVTPAPLRGSDD